MLEEKRQLLERYSIEEQASIYLLHSSLTHNFNDVLQYANYIECPTEINKKIWHLLQSSIGNIKLAMEKQIDPFSFFIFPLQ